MKDKELKNLSGSSRITDNPDAFDRKFASKYKAEFDQIQFDEAKQNELLARLRFEKAATNAPSAPKKRVHARRSLQHLALAAAAVVLIVGISFSLNQKSMKTSAPGMEPDTNQEVGMAGSDYDTEDNGQELDEASDLPLNPNETDSNNLTGAVNPTNATGAAATDYGDYPFRSDVEGWFVNRESDSEENETEVGNGAVTPGDSGSGGGVDPSYGIIHLHPETADLASLAWLGNTMEISDGLNPHLVSYGQRSTSDSHEFLFYFDAGQPSALEWVDRWFVEVQTDGSWQAMPDRSGQTIFKLSASLDAEAKDLYKTIENDEIIIPTPNYLLLRFAAILDTMQPYRLVLETSDAVIYVEFNH